MKTILKLLIFVLITNLHYGVLWAADSLLTVGLKELEKDLTPNITKMSPQGRKAYQEMRDLAASHKAVNRDAVVFHRGNEASDFSVFVPISDAHKSGGTIQQVQFRSDGQVIRSAFKIPTTEQEPTAIILGTTGKAGGETPWVSVTRYWETPTGETRLEQHFKSLDFDGRVLRVLQQAQLRKYHLSITAESDSGWGGGHKLHLELRNYENFAKGTLAPPVSGWLKDTAITGEIIGFNFTSDASRLTVQTSDGLEFNYSVSKENGELHFARTNIGQADLSEFGVAVKEYRGRAVVAENELVHGITVEGATGGTKPGAPDPITESVK